jgi:hypothetical protein
VYRAAGCVDPTYRIEAKVIAATGKAEECAATVGLDPAKCQLVSRVVVFSACYDWLRLFCLRRRLSTVLRLRLPKTKIFFFFFFFFFLTFSFG